MAEYVPIMFKKYKEEVIPYLMKKFGYKNVNQVPKIEKINLNMGVGDAKQDAKLLENSMAELSQISGQKPAITTAKKAISKAMKGKKNAEKWTEQRVKILLLRMLDFATKEHAHLKIELLIQFKIYNRSWFKDMKRKFRKHDTISPLLSALDMVCEINLYRAGLVAKSGINLIKMNLATHYGWTTKAKRNINNTPQVHSFEIIHDTSD